jgi:hypothetical protein
MNTHRRVVVTLVGIITTCVMSAGAASAKPTPLDPSTAGTAAPGPVVAQQASGNTSGAKDRVQLLLKQKSYIERAQRDEASDAAADARASAVRRHPQGSPGGSAVAPADQGSASNAPSQRSGDGSEVPVLAVTALAGLALGAAGSSASRRLRRRPGLAACRPLAARLPGCPKMNTGP